MKKCIKYLFNNIEEILLIFFFSVMCICMFLQLTSRYFFNSPLFFTEEVSRFSYIWMAFIGVSYAIMKNSHIRVEMFTQSLPFRVRSLIKILINVICILLFICAIVWGVHFANFTKVIKSPALQISKIYVAIAIPIGFTLSLIRSLKLIVEEIKQYRSLKKVS